MTVEELEEKIAEIEIVQQKATGLRLSRINKVVSDLQVKKTELKTRSLREFKLPLTTENLKDLTNISETFKKEQAVIADRNALLDRVIGYGKKLVGALT